MDDSCDGAINLEEFSKLVPGWVFPYVVVPNIFLVEFYKVKLRQTLAILLTFVTFVGGCLSDWKSDPKRQKVGENRELQGFGNKGRVTAAGSPAGWVFLFWKNDRCPQDSRPVNPDLAAGTISLFFLF